MNKLNRFLKIGQQNNSPLQVKSLFLKNKYSYRPFQDILDNQILRNVHKFNQDIFLNQKQIDYLSNTIFHMHNSQNLIFLFRLFKLFNLTPEQFENLYQAQRRKYKDFHEIRQISDKSNYQLRQQKEFYSDREKRNSGNQENNSSTDDKFNQKGKGRDQNSVDNSVQAELQVIYKMRNELKDVIWQINNLHKDNQKEAFLYHIFINKQLNKLIHLAFNYEAEADIESFEKDYLSIDRQRVTAEQMCLLLILLSLNEKFENIHNIFEGEIESILQVIRDKEISYQLGKFLIRLGLNHLQEIQQNDVQLSSSQSIHNTLVKNSSIHLDQQSLYLYLYDLKNKKHGVDVQFFLKFNREDILQKLNLEEIDELIQQLISADKDNKYHQEIIKNIISQIIQNSVIQAENLKIYNDILLKQLQLVVKYKQYSEINSLAQVLSHVSLEIVKQASSKVQLTNSFTKYIVDFISFCPHDIIDFYQLFECFFFKQTIEKISYQQLIQIYKQMAITGVDYQEYLEICHKVFFMNKHDILEKQDHLHIIPLAEKLHDVETANIFGIQVKAKKQIPENIGFLSDLSESDDEINQQKKVVEKH